MTVHPQPDVWNASGSLQPPPVARPARRAHSKKQTRMAINLSPDAAEFLTQLTTEHGITYTEAIRRALAVYKLVIDETAAGHHVQLYDGHKTREIVLI